MVTVQVVVFPVDADRPTHPLPVVPAHGAADDERGVLLRTLVAQAPTVRTEHVHRVSTRPCILGADKELEALNVTVGFHLHTRLLSR